MYGRLYIYHTSKTAKKKIKKEGDITLQHIAIMSIWCSFSCTVDLTRRRKLFKVFVFYICCFVIVNMPVIYVCCFASAMRNQVDYYPLNSIYGPYAVAYLGFHKGGPPTHPPFPFPPLPLLSFLPSPPPPFPPSLPFPSPPFPLEVGPLKSS